MKGKINELETNNKNKNGGVSTEAYINLGKGTNLQ
jgi:hypothetical protein